MEIYLVGGAVRDKLLGLQPKEFDWVVVGATPNDMIKLGYKSVGKDFPVFLHPKTKEEYALARKERKVGKGYTGFEFDTSPDVTLEEDLKRRDLTINAMAQEDGKLIDPYGGEEDLKKKVLRHVSPAFAEDPVRILRVARFAARYKQYDFTVAPETMDLMKQMVDNGEVDALVPERVWKELERALGEKNPEAFFHVLVECGALPKLFPELKSPPGTKEGFLGETNLIETAKTTEDKEKRFGALVSKLSKPLFAQICDRYRIPTTYRDHVHPIRSVRELNLNSLESRYEDEIHDSYLVISLKGSKKAKRILQFLNEHDVFRRGERFLKSLETADILKIEDVSLLRECYFAAKTVTAAPFVSEGLSGKQLGERINAERLKMIEEILRGR